MKSPEQVVRAIAASKGVNPDLAVSIWQQESGRSTNTGLRGETLSRGRGAAVGPWQVVPHYHPDFPVSGSFEDQTRYALDYLKEVGPARYYGTGKAPAGHPTSEQYVNQVMNRVPGSGHNIPASAITGDPSAYSGGSIMPVSAIPQGTLMPDAQQQQTQQPQGLLGNLDPALGGLIGLSMLAGSFGGGQQGGMGGALASLMPLLMPQQGNAPAAPKMGTTTIKRGDEEVTFLTKDGVPVQEIGTAPRWQPPGAADDRTSVMQNLEAAGLSPGSDEYRSAMLDYVTKPGVNITQVPKAPSGYAYKDPTNPGLGLEAIPGGPATQPTGEERSAAAYAERMQSAEKQLVSVEDAPQMQGSKEAGVDAALAAGGRFTYWLRSPAGQQHQNAADQWIRAKLRKESGATIAQEEWDSEYKTYFPQPGDSEEVKKQKAEARKVATRTMMTQAGRAQPDLTPTDDDMQEILDLIP